MSGLIGIISEKEIDKSNIEKISETLNLGGKMLIESMADNNTYFFVSRIKNTPLSGNRLYENRQWNLMFSGDIIEYASVPFAEIIWILESKNYSNFEKFVGIFVISALDKINKILYVITDIRSQHPVYYFHNKEYFCFSTELSTYSRLDISDFNKKWLWEYLYFNFPISENTYIEGVKRLPAASVFKFDLTERKGTVKQYSKFFTVKNKLLEGNEALELAKNVFARTVPKYFEGAKETACALTGGWDGRSIIALSKKTDITSYTYGCKGCYDVINAANTAKLSRIKHEIINFNDDFIRELPNYMLDTVYLSSGLEKVLRSTILYVYQNLTEFGEKFPLTLSGIGIDMLFRGHCFSPTLVSYDMAENFKGNKDSINKELWKKITGEEYKEFKEHINYCLEYLKGLFGPFTTTMNHLSYILYVISPQYFCGELKTAGNYTTIRVPSWDNNIIDLSYSIKESTLSYSQFSSHKRGGRDEMVLQSHILKTCSPAFSNIPIRNTRPDIVLKNIYFYNLYSIYRRALRRISRIIHPELKNAKLEDWKKWLNETHRNFIEDLIFSRNSEVRFLINKDYLKSLREDRNIHYIGKIATLEIILKLLKNKWEKINY